MAEEPLISKKDVLELTGISYGQFYRWKRKGLIPESWFIRKSTFTGQETFLPREKVLGRIQKIQSLKDEHSLEDLAQLLAPEIRGRDYAAEEVAAMGWLSREVLDFYDGFRNGRGGYAFHDLLFLTVLERLRKDLDDGELALAAATLVDHAEAIGRGEGFHWTLVVARKPLEGGLSRVRRAPALSVCCLSDGRCLFDHLTETAVKLDLHPVLEDLKMKLSKVT